MRLTKRSVPALLLCACLLLASLLSAGALLAHEGHECGGEECPVCACLDHSAGLLKTIGLALAFLAGWHVLYCWMCRATRYLGAAVRPGTPIGLHVRMNH